MPSIEHNGNRIHYSRLDDGSAPDTFQTPVILHHGLAQWSDDWVRAGWLDAFEGRAVYALDALGHGRSDRPPVASGDRSAYSMENRADAVMRIADDAGLDRFICFGFSMGGRVGFELAANGDLHGGRLEKLIVGGMHGLVPSIDRRNLERRIAVLRSSKWRLVERAVGASRSDGRDNEAEALAVSTEAVLDWGGAEDRLRTLAIPTLIYCGTSDSILEYAAQTAALVPGCTFEELPGTGHAASFYSSEQARTVVAKFLG